MGKGCVSYWSKCSEESYWKALDFLKTYRLLFQYKHRQNMKFFILVTFYIATVKAQILNQKLKEEEKLNKVILPPCAACSVVVNSISSLVNKDDKTDFGNVKFKICTVKDSLEFKVVSKFKFVWLECLKLHDFPVSLNFSQIFCK